MNCEELELYKKLVGKAYAEVDFNYHNTDLEKLMSDKNLWKRLKAQLTPDERKTLTAYKNYKADPDWGFGVRHIAPLEAIAARMMQLHQTELNTRWLVQDEATGLYWANIINPPFWRRSDKALMFKTEKEANRWVNGFIKASGRFEFRAKKYDATKRFERWDRNLKRLDESPNRERN